MRHGALIIINMLIRCFTHGCNWHEVLSSVQGTYSGLFISVASLIVLFSLATGRVCSMYSIFFSEWILMSLTRN